jgi:hypothetical protein
MLPSLILLRPPPTANPSPEDYFASSLGTLFTDDCSNQHGDGPDTVILYKSQRFGELELAVAEPSGEVERRKFAHYLWNAGVLMGELVGGRGRDTDGEVRDNGAWVRGAREGGGAKEVGTGEADTEEEGAGWDIDRWWVSEAEEELWKVEGETVLELGAGWFETMGGSEQV